MKERPYIEVLEYEPARNGKIYRVLRVRDSHFFEVNIPKRASRPGDRGSEWTILKRGDEHSCLAAFDVQMSK